MNRDHRTITTVPVALEGEAMAMRMRIPTMENARILTRSPMAEVVVVAVVPLAGITTGNRRTITTITEVDGLLCPGPLPLEPHRLPLHLPPSDLE